MTFRHPRPVRWLSAALVLTAVGLAGCSETQLAIHSAKRVAQSVDESRAEGRRIDAAKVRRASLRPYQIKGRWYYPADEPDYDETGIASWYGDPFHGRLTASGEIYDKRLVTAAHKTLPLPATVRVTNLENGRVLTVRVNDRGPFVNDRIIDMSQRGAQLLGFERQGVARVRVERIGSEDDRFVLRDVKTPRKEQKAVAAAPRQKVKVEALPPPGGTGGDAAVAQSTPSRAPVTVSTPLQIATGPAKTEADVTRVPVKPTRLFVQAGSFTQFENANRLRARLSPLGPVVVQQALINDTDFFRVRIGPLADVEAADRMLARAMDAGISEAHIVVD